MKKLTLIAAFAMAVFITACKNNTPDGTPQTGNAAADSSTVGIGGGAADNNSLKDTVPGSSNNTIRDTTSGLGGNK